MKYFYTDPIAAAWMAKHFGMRYMAYEDDPPLEWNEMKEWPWWSIYIIHPGSLHLLEPQVGDIVEHGGIEYGIVIGIEKDEVGIQFCEDEDGKTLCASVPIKEITIIQRADKAFMWPECEP